jgi:hypothetical protein
MAGMKIIGIDKERSNRSEVHLRVEPDDVVTKEVLALGRKLNAGAFGAYEPELKDGCLVVLPTNRFLREEIKDLEDTLTQAIQEIEDRNAEAEARRQEFLGNLTKNSGLPLV